jgi:hypothetical protein
VMSPVDAAERNPVRIAAPVVEGMYPSVLDRILDPESQLVLWHRPVMPTLSAWLDGLAPACLPDGRVLIRPDETAEALAAIFEMSGTPACAERSLLANDVVLLADAFRRITKSPLIDLRIERISGNACRKFHRDNVSLRLLTTYRGPGTQWVTPAWEQQALSAQMKYSGPVKEMPRYSTALFRGCQDAPDEGVVHRSPPIAGSGTTRLLLCINLPSRASPNLWAGIKSRQD